MRQIAHIINPFRVEKSSDLFVAHHITFETMKIAREFAREQVDVTLLSTQYPDDRSIVPEGFRLTPELDRSILDIGTFQKKLKLPLIKDILDRLYESTDADYLIYTNVDIALMPYFYSSVSKIIDDGYDAFVINRRTTSDKYKSIDEIPFMYAEIGESHKGYDCFVFERNAYPRYKFGSVCIGMAWVGRTLLANLLAYASQFKELKNEHLTFHIGNERSWKSNEYADYTTHNRNQYLKIIASLEAELGEFEPNVQSFLLDTGEKREQLKNS
jgi:hypothetical protein